MRSTYSPEKENSMNNIYDQYGRAMGGISAYAILKAGVVIGKVVFKRGNCRVTAWTHLYGLEMSKGIANGGGYDMCSAAASVGFAKSFKKYPDNKQIKKMANALKDDGQHWDGALRAAGFEIVSIA